MKQSPDLPHTAHRLGRLRLLGLQRASREKRARPSCVMLQIDGLSHENFQRALQTGKLPFLARLLEQRQAVAGPWRSMLPTSTSAFQTGLFYGNNDDIPGFFWYDKTRGRKVKMNGSEDTARLEEEMKGRVAPYPGLLAGGSSYSALFTGGAENTIMTFARLFSPRYNLKARRGWIWLFILSQFLLLARVAYYTLIEFCLCIYDLVRALLTGKNRSAEFKFIIPRIFSVVICREIATLATILDIWRGVGPVYVNYFAYDEHAHLRGPDSRFAYWTLRGIDASIHRIWRAAEKARRQGVRHYDVFVWSDHGQTPSVPFHELFQGEPGQHFDMLFRALYGPLQKGVAGGETRRKKPPVAPGYVEMQGQRAEQLSEMGPRWMRRVMNPLIRPAREVEAYLEQIHPPDPEHRISFVSTGPVAHLCVDSCAAPLSYEDWCEQFPLFLKLIAQHQGIGFTLARTRAGGCRVGYDGHWLDLAKADELRRHLPRSMARMLTERSEEFRRWANMKSAGDLLIFGQREAGRPAIAYTYEFGSHGGPSPQETAPFIVVPAAIAASWPEVGGAKSERLLTLADLHRRLRMTYNPQNIIELDPAWPAAAPVDAPAEPSPFEQQA